MQLGEVAARGADEADAAGHTAGHCGLLYSPAMQKDVRTLARGGGTLLLATLVGNALLLVLDVYLNGVLGNEAYGLFGVLRRILQFAGFVVLLGMENAVIRFVAMDPERGGATVRRAGIATVVASLALMGVAIAGADVFAAWIDPGPDTARALRIGALSLPLAAVRTVAVSASQGWKVIWHRAAVMFVAWPLVQLAGVALLAQALGMGIIGAMWAWTASMGFGAALAVGLLARGRTLGREAAPLGPLLQFAWPGWVQGMLMAAYTWVDQVVLAGVRSTTDAGFYGPVAARAPLLGFGLGALNGQFAPIIAEKHEQGDTEGLQRLYRTVTRWAVAFAVPPMVVCVVLPEAVLGLWPNASPTAATALRIACLAQLFYTGVGSVNYLLIMAGQQRQALYNGVPALALNLGLAFALAPRWGVTGAAVANAAAMCAANGLGLWQVWHFLRLHPFDRNLAKPLLAAIPTGVVVWMAHGLSPLFAVVGGGLAGGVTFLAVMALLGLDEDDRAVVVAVRKRMGA